MESNSRVFSTKRTVRVGDCNSNGAVRIDALARYLQDIGYDDTNDIGVGDGGNWVARFIEMNFENPELLPKRNEVIELKTYCAGIGRASAKRNVEISSAGGASISTSTIWVHVDNSGKPIAIPEWLNVAYPNVPSISSKRTLPILDLSQIPEDIKQIQWPLRASDFDINNHINNAVAFDALYEIASILEAKAAKYVAVEFHQPIGDTKVAELYFRQNHNGFEVWMANDKTVASAMKWSF